MNTPQDVDYVLNPTLLSLIERANFGPVHVINRGDPIQGYYEKQADGTERLVILERGESYITDCPFCNDNRQRLSVNHYFGVKDPRTGYYNKNLWKCYNEECQSQFVNRQKLYDLIFSVHVGPSAMKIRPPRVAPKRAVKLEPCEFPGMMVKLTELDYDHPARTYLETDRAFDLDELVDLWEIGFALHMPARQRGAMAQGRIIIPVYQDGVMVGWQARYVGEADWKAIGQPKYLTYYPKSQVVYGLDRTKDSPYIVLVEGCTDVWRFGPGAVAQFGHDLSPHQAELVCKVIGDRPFVIMPDMDDPKSVDFFYKSAGRLRERGYKGVTAVAPLPKGKDPANLTRAKLHKIVQQSIEAARRLEQEHVS